MDKNENWHLLVHLYDYRDGYPPNPNQTMPVPPYLLLSAFPMFVPSLSW
jgi:hypothetical protein